MIFSTKTIRYLFVAGIINLAVSSAVADDEFRVTLLGTGDPIPRTDRFGPSTLEDLISRTRKSYDGPFVIGEDLRSFIIDDEVTQE